MHCSNCVETSIAYGLMRLLRHWLCNTAVASHTTSLWLESMIFFCGANGYSFHGLFKPMACMIILCV